MVIPVFILASLAATDVNDDFRIRPLGKLVLDDGFTAAERSGNSRNAAARNGEQRIDNALSRNHGFFGR